jgi:hypothetical protein
VRKTASTRCASLTPEELVYSNNGPGERNDRSRGLKTSAGYNNNNNNNNSNNNNNNYYYYYYFLREEHRLRAFENKVLRRIFGLKRDKVTGG